MADRQRERRDRREDDGVFRRRDPIDYALVAVVTLLAYLELPVRPAIRRGLRSLPGRAAVVLQRANEADPTFRAGVAVLAVAAVGLLALVVLGTVLPALRR